ncbi:MAG: PhoH family protein [Gammaproteobacteria bacterium]|nr:PhoH family protein [Gammaproteobacteria bacterium]
MNASLDTLDLLLEPADNERLANLSGAFDEHLRQLETRLGLEIHNRGCHFQLKGDQQVALAAAEVIKELYRQTADESLTPEMVHLSLQESGIEVLLEADESAHNVVVQTKRAYINPRGRNQQEYVTRIQQNDLTFGVGPAGTGKTYLAVACAVEALEAERVRRLVLVRPAVEAGERLGFLPGDMTQKVDPYLRPIYDALYEMLGFERVAKLIERNVIEVAPLAYMRGRTLNHSFVIMDEAQNTTVEQMKMFLTRIGFGSTAVVTGDVTQIDLPKHVLSGLKQVNNVLQGIEGVNFIQFQARDVVRHPLVQRIVTAYERFERSDH